MINHLDTLVDVRLVLHLNIVFLLTAVQKIVSCTLLCIVNIFFICSAFRFAFSNFSALLWVFFIVYYKTFCHLCRIKNSESDKKDGCSTPRKYIENTKKFRVKCNKKKKKCNCNRNKIINFREISCWHTSLKVKRAQRVMLRIEWCAAVKLDFNLPNILFTSKSPHQFA